MPIYEYMCTECGHHLEILQKVSDAPVTQCVNCKRDTLTKMISKSGFRLKGSGWYETDFKGGDNKKQRNLAKDPGEGGSSKTDSKTEVSSKSDTSSASIDSTNTGATTKPTPSSGSES